MRSKVTQERGEEMHPVIRSETLHSKPRDVFMASKADRRPLSQRPDRATEKNEDRIYIRHRAPDNNGAQGPYRPGRQVATIVTITIT